MSFYDSRHKYTCVNMMSVGNAPSLSLLSTFSSFLYEIFSHLKTLIFPPIIYMEFHTESVFIEKVLFYTNITCILTQNFTCNKCLHFENVHAIIITDNMVYEN